MLGYCVVCEKLVPIRRAGRGWDYQIKYFPHEHDRPTGGRCDGTKREIK